MGLAVLHVAMSQADKPQGECASPVKVVPGIRQRNRQVSHPSGGSALKLFLKSCGFFAAGRCNNRAAMRICGVKDAADEQAMSVEAVELCLLQRFYCLQKVFNGAPRRAAFAADQGCSPALYPLELNQQYP